MKPKWLDFTGLKILESEAVLPHHWAHRASAGETFLLRLCVISVESATFGFPLARMWIKLFNLAALLYF